MGLAKMTGAAVVLVGDIDRGGVFARFTARWRSLTMRKENWSRA